nr:hypothetical protein Iba_chr02eCG12240 [Ipomoea batatas]
MSLRWSVSLFPYYGLFHGKITEIGIRPETASTSPPRLENYANLAHFPTLLPYAIPPVSGSLPWQDRRANSSPHAMDCLTRRPVKESCHSFLGMFLQPWGVLSLCSTLCCNGLFWNGGHLKADVLLSGNLAKFQS